MNEIIISLEELTSLHRQLLALSEQKTEVIKEGAVDDLQSLLVKERKLVRKTEAAEKIRGERAERWFAENHPAEQEATVTNLLAAVPDRESKEKIEKAAIELTRAITSLKAQEQLNLALISQSMQFVQLSLDLLSPSLKNMNYGNQQNTDGPDRSVFDSKA